jgi:hypothetical protein
MFSSQSVYVFKPLQLRRSKTRRAYRPRLFYRERRFKREVQQYTILTEHDGTDGTSFIRAASQRAVFLCVTEYTRNIDGTNSLFRTEDGRLSFDQGEQTADPCLISNEYDSVSVPSVFFRGSSVQGKAIFGYKKVLHALGCRERGRYRIFTANSATANAARVPPCQKKKLNKNGKERRIWSEL